MHIIYFHQHFSIPQGSTGTRSYEFAKRWVQAGHKVTVITGYYDVSGLPTSKKLVNHTQFDGIDIIAIGVPYSNKQSFLRRIYAFMAFLVVGAIVGLFQKKVDVVFATSAPLTIAIPAIICKWFRGWPYIFEVRDQWPATAIALGAIRNRLFQKALYRLERFAYKQSRGIVALSPGMAAGIEKVLGPTQRPIITVPNCADLNQFRPEIDGREIRRRHGWDNEFLVIHAGAMGRANGLDFLVELATQMQEPKNIRFILLGSGGQRNHLEELVRQRDLKNVTIIPSVPKTELPLYLAACDVATVIVADVPIMEHNSANKFFDALSAGKPVLLNYAGWQKDVLDRYQAGYGCKLWDIDEFRTRLLELYQDPNLRSAMGKEARRAAEELFDRDKLARQVLSVLENCHK